MCIPKTPMRVNLIKENDYGGLTRYFGIEKTLSLLKDKYYWPQKYKDVHNSVRTCGICQVAKEVRILVCLYTPIFVPEKL